MTSTIDSALDPSASPWDNDQEGQLEEMGCRIIYASFRRRGTSDDGMSPECLAEMPILKLALISP